MTSTYEPLIYFNVNNDELLQILRMNSEIILPGETGYVDIETFSVNVTATTLNNATYSVSGNTYLQPGNNTVTVTVTSADGTTTENYEFTVYVNRADVSSDTSLASIQVNGLEVIGGFISISSPNSVEVTATSNYNATYTFVIVNDYLQEGDNTIIVTVVAEDGTTTEDYIISVYVKSSNPTLSALRFNGDDILNGSVTFYVNSVTTFVDIIASSDYNAVITISGNTDLSMGYNLINIHIVAENEIDYFDYNLIVYRISASNPFLISPPTVNNISITNGSIITVPSNTNYASVIVNPVNPSATYTITGNTELLYGDNTVIITITAEDGITKKVYTFTVRRPEQPEIPIIKPLEFFKSALNGDSSTNMFRKLALQKVEQNGKPKTGSLSSSQRTALMVSTSRSANKSVNPSVVQSAIRRMRNQGGKKSNK